MSGAYEYCFSNEMMTVYMPIVAYWVTSGFYELLAYLHPDARLHSKEEEDEKNIPSRWRVIRFILFQQAFQIALFAPFAKVAGNDKGIPKPEPSLFVFALQIFVGMVIIDTVQYFGHRYLHINKFLYKHLHSLHHTVIVPYPSAGLYSHPLDGIPLDVVGSLLASLIPRMSPRTTMYFLCFANIRTAEVHCGLWLPWSPSQMLFGNNPAFHETHHQPKGHSHNFAQPFFLAWDKILRTYMPFTVEKRKEGGYHVRMIKDY